MVRHSIIILESDVNLVACTDYCKNGAQCIVGIDEVECKCPPGFAGKRCDVNCEYFDLQSEFINKKNGLCVPSNGFPSVKTLSRLSLFRLLPNIIFSVFLVVFDCKQQSKRHPLVTK